VRPRSSEIRTSVLWCSANAKYPRYSETRVAVGSLFGTALTSSSFSLRVEALTNDCLIVRLTVNTSAQCSHQ
jgi:hypothetical protein